jgi:methyl-accepting chemotaxis protein
MNHDLVAGAKGDVETRLRFLGITSDTGKLLREFWKVVEPVLPRILEGFYHHVASEPNLASMIGDNIPRLKKAQLGHWSHLFDGRFDEAYRQDVRAIGLIHHKIGLEPRWYVGGYHFVLCELTKLAVRAHRWSPTRLSAVLNAINAAVMLDMDIAISIYQEVLLAKQHENEVQEAVRQRAEQSAQDRIDQQRKESEDQRVVVAAVAGGLKLLSAGEVTYRITADLPDGYGQMKDDFNAAMARLQEVSGNIGMSIASIVDASTEFGNGIEDLSKRTEAQAAQIEATAAAMEELSATTKNNADNAHNAAAAAAGTQQIAETGGREVAQAMAAMDLISDSSRKISDIVGLIDEIAFQTNLLALNAAVEAARAGDAGKGFAVVAQEVRSLAQRCSGASKEIKRLIIESNQQVDQGVHLVRSTGQTLAGILGEAKRVAELMASISTASGEQSSGIDQVSVTITQMEATTQQNAALVEQSLAASDTLRSQGFFVAQFIDFFKIGAVGEQKATSTLDVQSCLF